jgi:hypothetical protein
VRHAVAACRELLEAVEPPTSQNQQTERETL